jgi:hypothetical protein
MERITARRGLSEAQIFSVSLLQRRVKDRAPALQSGSRGALFYRLVGPLGSTHLGRLCLNEGVYECVEVGWVYVADGDDAEVIRCGGVDGETRAVVGEY